MEILRAGLLGLIQGVTEFLPISSSGHLLLVRRLFGWDDFSLLFDVLLHCATLIVIVYYFRAPLLALFGWGTHARQSRAARADDAGSAGAGHGGALLLPLAVTTAATATVGFGIQRTVALDNLFITAVAYCITALLIVAVFTHTYLTNRRRRGALESRLIPHTTIGWPVALLVGVLQGIAVLPGISRAAATIMIARLCGVERTHAFEYSFLVAIPAILGALCLQLVSGEVSLDVSGVALLVAAAVALVTGYGSLRLLRYLSLHTRTIVFVPYLLFLAALCFTLQ